MEPLTTARNILDGWNIPEDEDEVNSQILEQDLMELEPVYKRLRSFQTIEGMTEIVNKSSSCYDRPDEC